MELKTMTLDEIKSYKRNPRKNDKAVGAVMKSIQQCQYVAPIVVDENSVILAGHTRWKALRQLGRTEAEVIVKAGLTEEQKRKYRLLDNKTAELAEWDCDLLSVELDGLDFDGMELDWGIEEEPPTAGPEEAEESEETEEYRQFVDKFKPKLTTDDCYTPENIYACVKNWVVEHYGMEGAEVVRPFWPGGDYQRMDYPEGCVVIDNPPFSILSDICRWYEWRGIRYFLFAPSLTLFSIASGTCNYVLCGVSVTYANGAKVSTSFVTNLGEWKVELVPELRRRISGEDAKNRAEGAAELPVYCYPNNVLTSAASRLVKYGQALRFRTEEVCFIRALDAQRQAGKVIYGAGFLLSDRATADRATADRAAAEARAAVKWALSERELAIVRRLGKSVEAEGPDNGP